MQRNEEQVTQEPVRRSETGTRRSAATTKAPGSGEWTRPRRAAAEPQKEQRVGRRGGQHGPCAARARSEAKHEQQ
ncbi:hypothetical protein [Arthrobacter methylotrophus]|uniref:hypothetical protein n=1 Tax=Arthrobacter methylotrophus TaxID=121291 RepID=UPI0031EFB129